MRVARRHASRADFCPASTKRARAFSHHRRRRQNSVPQIQNVPESASFLHRFPRSLTDRPLIPEQKIRIDIPLQRHAIAERRDAPPQGPSASQRSAHLPQTSPAAQSDANVPLP